MLVRSRLERGREDSQKNLQSSGNTPPLGLNVESAALQFQTRIQDTDHQSRSALDHWLSRGSLPEIVERQLQLPIRAIFRGGAACCLTRSGVASAGLRCGH